VVNIVYDKYRMMNQNNKYLSTTELANLSGISRIAVFKKIKKGEIKAKKKGRNYLINKADITGLNNNLSANSKKMIDNAVNKTVREYGETLRLLSQE